MNYLKKVLKYYKFKNSSSDFIQHLMALINNCSCYYYPEHPQLEVPDFSKSVNIETSPIKRLRRRISFVNTFLNLYDVKELEKSYNLFDDKYSKEMFLRVALFRTSETPILRFPLYYSKVFSCLDKLSKLAIDDEEIVLWYDIIHLKKYNLSSLGHDIKLWFSPEGLLIDFVIEQYRYRDIVDIEDGDNVLDCGACYGDTALLSVLKNKQNGHVYAFEFMPENLEIYNKNMALNPEIVKNITLVQKAVSDKSGKEINFVFNGPGTNIHSEKSESTFTAETVSIDDYVEQNNIEKIDFIKMDIEGSEEEALKGAVKTIKKYKPKLAICAYHKDDDLIVLPQLIKSILPEYKLYLDHNTISRNETVIYAKV